MAMRKAFAALLLSAVSCAPPPETKTDSPGSYLDFQTPGDVQAGGVRMIELQDGYRVWTKRFGNAPMKVLLLHGGPFPGDAHEY